MKTPKCIKSLERRLALKITFSIFFVMLIAWIIVFYVARTQWISELEKEASTYVPFVKQRVRLLESIYNNENLLKKDFEDDFITKNLTWLDTNYFVYKDGKARWTWYFDIPNLQDKAADKIEEVINDNKIAYVSNFEWTYFIFIEIKYKDAYIFFSHDIDDAFTFHRNLFKVLAIAWAFILIKLYFISLWATRKVLKPVRENTKLLAEFNHNVSHELRTPISIVKSNLELMEYVDNKKDLMDSSMDELSEMENIINSILLISKNKKPTTFETVNVEEVTMRYIDKVKDNYDKKLNFEFIDNWWKEFRANTELSYISIRNLVENLYKYARPDSTVEYIMSLDRITIKNKYDSWVVLDENMVTPFFQWDKSRNTKGYGLGLSIIRRVSELHGFEYKIYSKWDTCIQEIIIK